MHLSVILGVNQFPLQVMSWLLSCICRAIYHCCPWASWPRVETLHGWIKDSLLGSRVHICRERMADLPEEGAKTFPLINKQRSHPSLHWDTLLALPRCKKKRLHRFGLLHARKAFPSPRRTCKRMSRDEGFLKVSDQHPNQSVGAAETFLHQKQWVSKTTQPSFRYCRVS